jgi:catechol 2,3-dioxygenase-like lactoylglutathione lyase family enzyme
VSLAMLKSSLALLTISGREAAVSTPIENIGQIAITTHDVERAIGFYRDSLGLEFLFRAGPLAFFMCGGVRLMLAVPENRELDHPSSTIYFRVRDIRATREELAGRGVPFEDEPHLIAELEDHELWMTFFRDPDRNYLGLMSEVPRAAAAPRSSP